MNFVRMCSWEDMAKVFLSLALKPAVCAVQMWILAAKLEVRSKRLEAARKILGMAIGMAPKDKIFKIYIDMELQLGNVDRCDEEAAAEILVRTDFKLGLSLKI